MADNNLHCLKCRWYKSLSSRRIRLLNGRLTSAPLAAPTMFATVRLASRISPVSLKVTYPTGARSYRSKYFASKASSFSWVWCSSSVCIAARSGVPAGHGAATAFHRRTVFPDFQASELIFPCSFPPLVGANFSPSLKRTLFQSWCLSPYFGFFSAQRFVRQTHSRFQGIMNIRFHEMPAILQEELHEV